ncbi:MAG: hypothetical protein Q7T61_19255 [Caulobacter sp.]|nr:hypothetical protein [Caulobacter sp.]
MRAPMSCLFAGLLLLGRPALAQVSVNAYGVDAPIATLLCKNSLLFRQDWDVFAATPLVQAAPADQRAFCAFIGEAQRGPWKRYAIVSFPGASWCDGEQCTTVIFVEDRKGFWRLASAPAGPAKTLAIKEGVTVDFPQVAEGLPAFGMPYAWKQDVDRRDWIYQPKARRYEARKSILAP